MWPEIIRPAREMDRLQQGLQAAASVWQLQLPSLFVLSPRRACELLAALSLATALGAWLQAWAIARQTPGRGVG